MRADTMATEAFRFAAYDAAGNALYYSGTFTDVRNMFGVAKTVAEHFPACAAVVAGREQGLLDDDVEVHLRGGRLAVRYDGAGPIWMRGPAERVYEGRLSEQG